MARPLEGLRVVDLTRMFAGPGTGMYLADMGADVVRVEPPDGGADRAGGKPTASFVVLNRGKRSLALDIRHPQGREVVYALARRSDVLLVAWPPGQAERLGFGYEAMAALNPRLVYASITGWGPRGPLARLRGYDRLMQAHTGMMASRPAPDGTPLDVGFFPADEAIPMALCYGIMLALWQRERTGLGQKVEISQLQAMIAMQSISLVQAERHLPPPSREIAWRPTHTYRAADGRHLVLVPITEQEWAALWRCLELPELAADERLRSPEGREAHLERIHAALAARFATRPLADWLAALGEAGVPSTEVLTRAEFLEQPHAWETGLLVRVEHPEVGQTAMMAPAVQLSATPGYVSGPAPALGQHTREVLRELGYDEAAIEALYRDGVAR